MMETVRRRAPVGVVQGEVHEGQRFRYLEEVLGHAGVFFDYVAADHLLPEAWEHQVLILPGAMPLSDSAQHALTSFVRQGGGLLGLGGTSGLDAIFGVRGGDEFTEGYLLVREEEHPLTADLRSSLHVFGGQVVHAAEGTTLAELDSGGVVGDAVVVNSYGAGTAVLLAPEVLGSIVH
ncbi:MAG TPA: hypothetical protein EYP85_02495, partial [Armatimonadetes bacterium]|nr:hypothetical protein [Armatimonadota bacterium]